jgi:hypothetical protein
MYDNINYIISVTGFPELPRYRIYVGNSLEDGFDPSRISLSSKMESIPNHFQAIS